jgi:DedD protein
VNSRYDRDNDLQDLHESDTQDREISLGTTTILGIFFALALLCAMFFGLGYSLGRHSVQPVASAADATTEPESSSSSKPAPGSPLNQGRNNSSAQQTEIPQDHSSADAPDESQQEPAPPSPVKTVIATPALETHAASSAKAPAPRPVAAMVPVAAGSGALVVQVAAVSHQEDATILAAALKQRGYNVSIRQAPQDKLLHVQVGPFASKKEADAMRQRLQADGYNAIVK